MYDPVIGSFNYIQEQLVAYPYVEENSNMIHLNKSYMALLKASDEECGYAAYREKYLVYPAAGVQPPIPESIDDKCYINDLASYAAFGSNPCFNGYEINTQCKSLSKLMSQQIERHWVHGLLLAFENPQPLTGFNLRPHAIGSSRLPN